VLAVAYAQASVDVPDRARAMSDAARREANLTLKLDPHDAGAYAILSDLEAPDDYRSREAILLRGMKFGTHPKQPVGALYSYEATLLSDVGRMREALAVQLIAHATDEWGPPKTAQLARAYANVGNLSAARSWIQKGVQTWPNHSGVRRVRQYIAGFYEQPSVALPMFENLDAQRLPDDRQGSVWRSFIEARSARSPSATESVIRGIRNAADQNKISLENETMMMAALGEHAQAIAAVNRALDNGKRVEPWFLFTPVARSLRQDVGFVDLAARLGLIKYWRDTRKWPDFCADASARSECSPQLLAAIKSR
jgi:tetratricopeptide (TPR) repeat protein